MVIGGGLKEGAAQQFDVLWRILYTYKAVMPTDFQKKIDVCLNNWFLHSSESKKVNLADNEKNQFFLKFKDELISNKDNQGKPLFALLEGIAQKLETVNA